MMTRRWLLAALLVLPLGCDDASSSEPPDASPAADQDVADGARPTADAGDAAPPADAGDAASPADAGDAGDVAPPADPVARAGADRRVRVGATVMLNGSASTDARIFEWRITSRPEGSTSELDAADRPTPSLVADAEGHYELELSVGDGATDTLAIEALPDEIDPQRPASIAVGARVVATDIEPIGANLTRLTGGTNLAVNNHVNGSGFEPMVLRRLIRVDRAGTGDGRAWLEWDTDGGVGFWDTNATGFGDGATIRFYRLVDAAGSPLAYAGGLVDVGDADHVVFLGEAQVPPGGWVAEGDGGANRVYVDDEGLELEFGDYAFILIEKSEIPIAQAHPRLHEWWDQSQPYLFLWGEAVSGRLVPHPEPLPAAFTEPGRTCLAITSESAELHAAGQWVYHPFDQAEGQWYSQLRPGASYRVEAWLRQDGLGDGGHVRFAFVGNRAYEAANQDEPWAVTETWQRFSYDFVAPDYPAPDSGAHIGHALRFTGPGTLYLDNFLLYRTDDGHRAFGPHENTFEELRRSFPERGPKPAVRFYPLQYGNSTIDAQLGNYGNASLSVNDGRFRPFGGATIAQSMAWAYATGDDPDSRVVPYLTVSEEYTEVELRALVEYLGVPFDPATDTPEGKPYAHRRYLQRGMDTAPWTDAFREILVEYGNETWHNGAGGFGWHGFGPPGWVHRGGVEYGLFARYMLAEQVAGSDAWATHDLGARIKFVLGANYTTALDEGYGELAVQRSPAISYLGHANYVGPKWETGDEGSSRFDDHGLQETLVGRDTSMAALIEGAAASRDALADQGIDYRLIAYEGGPSGYWTNRDDPEIDELYGKSLAMGVAALDTWLYSSLHGFGHQCYLGFSVGRWWTSHTPPEAGGFRAHPGWLALRLRNRHAPGQDMLEVVTELAPSYDRRGSRVPLVSAYALRGPDALYVFVLSRKLDDVTPVTLHLPLTDAPSAIDLHELAHPDGSPADPRENNRERLEIDIVETSIDRARYAPDFVVDENTGGVAGGMPPGTVFLYTFHLAQ